MKKRFFLILMALLPMVAIASDIEVANDDGVTIFYNYFNSGTELEVVNKYGYYYSGSVVIPEEVTYNDKTYRVTNIHNNAFSNCSGLISVTIPNSMINIGNSAFSKCTGLTSVTIGNGLVSIGNSAFNGCNSLPSITIPNSATSIGSEAFRGCSGLTSVTIGNGVINIGGGAFRDCTSLTTITIPDSATSIESCAFQDCSGLTSVTIGNGVTSIGTSAFKGCSNLTSITIPDSVEEIGESAFNGCSGLTSVTIGNGVTSISHYAFYECSGLTSINIPDGVTTIGNYTFSNCSGLTKITIGSGIQLIGNSAFAYCTELTDMYCYAETVPKINGSPFYNSPTSSATLHVPETALQSYKTTYPWSSFGFFMILVRKCETPTISYANGELTFNCETEGVTFIYNTDIEDEDIKDGIGDKVQFSVTYHVSVYATKEGCDDSDVATGTLCWIDVEPKTEGIAEDAVHEIKALPVLIQSHGGTISVQGLDAGTEVFVYSTDGKQQGSAMVVNGVTTIHTSLQPGSIAVVRIGEKSVKVLLK